MTEKNTENRYVTLEVRAAPGSEVYVAGDFTEWETHKHKLKQRSTDGIFSTVVAMPAGRHEYKFLINGTWCIDPECTEWAQNEHGSLNSVVTIE